MGVLVIFFAILGCESQITGGRRRQLTCVRNYTDAVARLMSISSDFLYLYHITSTFWMSLVTNVSLSVLSRSKPNSQSMPHESRLVEHAKTAYPFKNQIYGRLKYSS